MITFSTHVNSYRRILSVTWPLALGMANNALMQFVDRVFLSRDCAFSLEAILPASMLVSTFACFFQASASYSSTFTAQYFGAQDRVGCVRSLYAGLIVALVGGILLSGSLPLAHLILAWADHAPEVASRERVYCDVSLLGSFFSCAFFALQGYFTGLGLTGRVFWVGLVGNLVNVVLDYVLILGCGPIGAWGMAGAAYATLFAQALQFLTLAVMAWMHIRAWMPSRVACACWISWRETLRLVPRLLRFAIPSGVHQLFNLLSFTIFVFVSASAGDLALATSNAVFTINYLLFAPLEGFAIGAGTLVGQCQGAGDAREAKEAAWRTLAVALVYTLVGCALVWLLRKPIFFLFASDVGTIASADFLALASTLLLLAISWQIFDAIDTVVAGALKGAGDTRFVMVWMLVCAFLLWLPLVLLVRFVHPTMPFFWGTMVVYVFVLAVGTLWRWHRGRWRTIRMV